jgi:hypothetical protein
MPKSFDGWVLAFGSALTLGVLLLHAFYTPVYGNCQQTPDGRSCDLIRWEQK